MEEQGGFFSDIEKVKALSSMMGGTPEGGQMDIVSMMEMAKKMNAMMNLFGDKQPANGADHGAQGKETEKNTGEKTEPAQPAEANPVKHTTNQNMAEIQTAEGDAEGIVAFSNRREKVLHAAIPFLDQEYQKDLYIIVRLLEMRRIMAQPEVLMESRSKGTKVVDIHQRRRQLLQAVRPYLSVGERAQVDQMAKLIEVRQIMNRREM